MKKVLATILAIVYLSTSMGTIVHLHYCMGKLVSWDLFSRGNQNCPIRAVPKKSADRHCITAKMGCCKDEVKQIKAGDDQKIVSTDFQILKLLSQTPAVNYLSFPDFHIPSFSIADPASNEPPDIGEPAIFLLCRNLRI